MKKKIIFFVIFALTITSIKAQISTKYFINKNAYKDVSFIKQDRKVENIKHLPSFNTNRMIEEDNENIGLDVPSRFGKGFDVNIQLADGEWKDVDNGRVWSMKFVSRGAYSINFVFENFRLSKGAKLYITNEDNSVLYGPVRKEHTTQSGYFLTDLIQGDAVTIYLFEPNNTKEKSNLSIKRVVHAYKNIVSAKYGNLGGSGNCNNDVKCFPNWSLESDAVALVLLSSGTEHCSGSLVMTADKSFRPYFLTAFHCIDLSQNGILSSTEISNAENWMFKFQYKKSVCNGSYATTGITYNAANFKAAWRNSDFALLELENSPIGNPEISLLGWDRSSNISPNATGIHHPSGDVMKISFDNDAIKETSKGLTTGGINYWFVDINVGTLERGSSGSPLFNSNKKVIGQLTSGYPGCNSSKQFWYGCFYRSWTGGGTNSTRLSNWLDPTNTGVMTTNTHRSPSLSGSNTICNQETYTIQNIPPNTQFTWQTSSNLQIVSSTNSSVTVKKISSGSGYIKAIHNDVVITKNVYIGVPNISFTVLGLGGPYGQLDAVVTGGNPPYKWYKNGSLILTSSQQQVTLPFGCSGGLLKVSYSHNCGTGTYSEPVAACSNYYSIYPNPASGTVTIQLEETEESSTEKLALNNAYRIDIYNMSGYMVRSVTAKENEVQIPLQGLLPGIYAVHLVKDGKVYKKKLVVE